jgi:PDZ domain
MRYAACALLFCFLVSSFSFCQDSKADLFAGYSYLNIDTNGLTSRQGANGGEASISGNFNKWFAAEADVSGYYKNYNIDLASLGLGTLNAKVTDYSYAAGPRINLRPIFIHVLFGGDHLTGSALGFSKSQDSLAGLAGGGVQLKVLGPWSVRASADYVFTRHNIFGGPSVTQNNYRASVGIVYSFGAKHASERQPRAAPVNAKPTHTEPVNTKQGRGPRAAAGSGMNISVLEVMVTLGRSQGAEITDEAPNGAAALAGIHVGDVINAVDGKPIRNPMELAAELSNKSAGDKIKLGYMIRGAWQTETTVILP